SRACPLWTLALRLRVLVDPHDKETATSRNSAELPRCLPAVRHQSTLTLVDMTAFGEMLQQLRAERDLTLSALARATHYNKGYLSKIERGLQRPTEDVARACDAILDARGDLVAAAHMDIAALRDSQPWQTTELLQRIQATDAAACTLDALHAT